MKAWRMVVALVLGVTLGAIAQNTVLVLTTVPNERRLISYDKEVKVGEKLHVEYEIYRNWLPCNLVINRYLAIVDERDFKEKNRTLVEHEERYITSETSLESVGIPVPVDLTPGKYLYYSRLAYTCNWVHKIVGPWTTRTDGIYITIKDKDK